MRGGGDTMESDVLLRVEDVWVERPGAEVLRGVNLTVHPGKHWILSKSGFASSDGRCRSFGEGGDGYVPGEGVGAVLLKPLARALADGDRIHAVIRSSALNIAVEAPSPNASTSTAVSAKPGFLRSMRRA